MTDQLESDPQGGVEPQPDPAPEQASEPQPQADPVPSPEVETAPVVVKEKPVAAGPYTLGTGRRKSSVARVRVRLGEGKFMVNKRDVDEFFCIDRDRAAVKKPLEVTGTGKDFDVFVNVNGGGISGQSGAVMLGLARALVKANPDSEVKLREHQLLTRDPRRVERKKYGQRGARRRFQFSKR